MLRKLFVFFEDKKVGTLEQDRHGALSFQYEDSWISNPKSIPLSISLPLRSERFKKNDCRHFFAGLLPEETNRELLAKQLGISNQNDFALLEKIGLECAGALSFRESEVVPLYQTNQYELLTEKQLHEKILSLPKNPLLTADPRIRLSLAGAQNKMVVKIEQNQVYLTINGAPSTHIIKPQSQFFPNIVENEFFCMQLALKVGLDVAETKIRQIQELMTLQITRFDREHLSQNIKRLHQEDFCQALGFPPERKYQKEGGPKFSQCFELIRNHSSVPAVDLLKLLDASIFNYLIGNNDAHAKNFSLIYKAKQTRLAPLYDLVCTTAYPELTEEMAMKIGAAIKHYQVIITDWREYLEDIQLNKTTTIKRIIEFTNKVRATTEEIAKKQQGITVKISQIILSNCEKLIEVLSKHK